MGFRLSTIVIVLNRAGGTYANSSIYVFYLVMDMFNSSYPVSVHLAKSGNSSISDFKNVENQVPFPMISSIVQRDEFMYLYITRQVN